MAESFPRPTSNWRLALAQNFVISYSLHLVADVAELADALDSKSSTRESVWVRPPPSAPLK